MWKGRAGRPRGRTTIASTLAAGLGGWKQFQGTPVAVVRVVRGAMVGLEAEMVLKEARVGATVARMVVAQAAVRAVGQAAVRAAGQGGLRVGIVAR